VHCSAGVSRVIQLWSSPRRCLFPISWREKIGSSSRPSLLWEVKAGKLCLLWDSSDSSRLMKLFWSIIVPLARNRKFRRGLGQKVDGKVVRWGSRNSNCQIWPFFHCLCIRHLWNCPLQQSVASLPRLSADVRQQLSSFAEIGYCRLN
jgi:hypothetical protein